MPTLVGNETDISGGASAGIAEVALPISFKLRNIEETERLEREMKQQRVHHQLHERNMHSNFRFQNNYNHEKPLDVIDLNQAAAHTDLALDTARSKSICVEGQIAGASALGGGGSGGDKRHRMSSDDKAMERYRKVMFLV
jgi:hypothetical protein